jgi:hypothetical protein
VKHLTSREQLEDAWLVAQVEVEGGYTAVRRAVSTGDAGSADAAGALHCYSVGRLCS